MSERLTKRDENGNAYYDWGCLNRNHWALGRHVDRLAAYEDTGLTPERIRELQNAFNILFESERQKQQENEQLRAQVARMREALIFTKEKIYEQLSNYVNDPKKFKYSAISIECVQKIVRALADASDYHNPADVAEIEKLRNVIEEIKDNLHAINCVREMPDKVEMYANEAISIIDEMGGKEE